METPTESCLNIDAYYSREGSDCYNQWHDFEVRCYEIEQESLAGGKISVPEICHDIYAEILNPLEHDDDLAIALAKAANRNDDGWNS